LASFIQEKLRKIGSSKQWQTYHRFLSCNFGYRRSDFLLRKGLAYD
jgi:hypothetical protein